MVENENNKEEENSVNDNDFVSIFHKLKGCADIEESMRWISEDSDIVHQILSEDEIVKTR